MKTIIILNFVTTLYLWLRVMVETLYITKDMEKKIYVYWDKLHSLQHIAWLLWGWAIVLFAMFYNLECYSIFMFNLYFTLFVISHFSYERNWELNNFIK